MRHQKMHNRAEDVGHTRVATTGLLKDLGLGEIKHLTDETPIVLASGGEVWFSAKVAHKAYYRTRLE